MDKSKLEQILQQSIQDLKILPGSKAGDNVAGALLAFDITTTSNQKFHLVHKTITDDPSGKDFTIQNQSFPIEIAFYSQLIPTLEAFTSSKGFNYKIPIPKYYDGFTNNNDDYLLLQDLRSLDYHMCDKYVGHTFDEVELILKELATFHAITYSFIKWEGEKVFEAPGLKIFTKNLFEDPNLQAFGTGMFNGAYENSIELIKKRDAKLADKMKGFHANYNTIEKMMEITLSTDKKYFPVIILGDLWTNNIMMKHDPTSGKPIDVKFIDFQLARRGNVFEDLKYFIFTSTTPDFRKKYLSQALDIYYSSFVKTLETLKTVLPINFTKGFFIDNFYTCIPSTYKYLSFAIPLQLGNPEAMKPPIEQNGGAEIQNGGKGNGLPDNHPPNGQIDMEAMMEMQLKIFVGGMKLSMETCPAATDRLFDVTVEMAELNII